MDGQKAGSNIEHPLSDQQETLRMSLKNTTSSLVSYAQAQDEILNSLDKVASLSQSSRYKSILVIFYIVFARMLCLSWWDCSPVKPLHMLKCKLSDKWFKFSWLDLMVSPAYLRHVLDVIWRDKKQLRWRRRSWSLSSASSRKDIASWWKSHLGINSFQKLQEREPWETGKGKEWNIWRKRLSK